MFKLLDYLREYDPTNLDKIKPREKTINNVRKLHNNRNNDIKTFENGVVFSFSHGFQKEKLDMSDKTLAKQLKVSEKIFDAIKNAVQNAKKIIYKLDHSVVALLILINQTN